MRRFVVFLILLLNAGILVPISIASGEIPQKPLVNTIRIDGAIDPAVALYVHRSIGVAEKNGAQALVILINTPGGLLDSTRSMVQDFYESRVPIVVYVWPQAARAASAGAILSLASNVAAMSPSTNIGAAHPVSIGTKPDAVMAKKIENDTAAFVRSIAKRRNRPMSWADEVVRNSISVTDTEAKEKGIIDVIAKDQYDLARQLDGRKTTTGSGEFTIHSANARIERIDASLRERFLHAIDNPNITYILMLLAIYGLIFELSNPGAILPGVVGGISLIMALFSFAVLPVNMTGIFLIVFAIALFLIDLHVPTHGILTVGGVISFAMGSLILFESQSPEFQISAALVITMALLTGAFFVFAIGAGIRAQKNRIVTGREGMIGQIGEARTKIDPKGKVFAEGTWWNAITNDEPIDQGEMVRIVGMEKLTLIVKREVPESNRKG